MGTLTNYEGLLALSASPHLSQAMRGYLVGVLSEHRELRAALRECETKLDQQMRVGATFDELNEARSAARFVLAKVQA